MQGLRYELELMPPALERQLLDVFEDLRWDPIVIRGQAARRTARHYGLDYDYEARTPTPGEPMPEWLEPARTLAAEFAGAEPDQRAEVLVPPYPPRPTIRRHREPPAVR